MSSNWAQSSVLRFSCGEVVTAMDNEALIVTVAEAVCLIKPCDDPYSIEVKGLLVSLWSMTGHSIVWRDDPCQFIKLI